MSLDKLVAADLERGGEPLLEPFRLSRFLAGLAHAASRSALPWN